MRFLKIELDNNQIGNNGIYKDYAEELIVNDETILELLKKKFVYEDGGEKFSYIVKTTVDTYKITEDCYNKLKKTLVI